MPLQKGLNHFSPGNQLELQLAWKIIVLVNLCPGPITSGTAALVELRVIQALIMPLIVTAHSGTALTARNIPGRRIPLFILSNLRKFSRKESEVLNNMEWLVLGLS